MIFRKGPIIDGECERCGAVGPGREKWMLHTMALHFRGHLAVEFYCLRCLRYVRFMSILFFTGAAIIILGILGLAAYTTLNATPAADYIPPPQEREPVDQSP